MNEKNITLTKKDWIKLAISVACIVVGLVFTITEAYAYTAIFWAVAGVMIYKLVNTFMEKKKIEQEQKKQEDETAKKEKALNDFRDSVDMEEELNYILETIQESLTIKSFEQGVENLLSRTNTSLNKTEVLGLLQEVLLNRVVKDVENEEYDTLAAIIMSAYAGAAVQSILEEEYLSIALLQQKLDSGRDSSTTLAARQVIGTHMVPFIKDLYGVSLRAWNYNCYIENDTAYHPASKDLIMEMVKEDETISSYCNDDPFRVDEVRKMWADDISAASYKITKRGNICLGSENNEKALDMLCSMGCYYLTGKRSLEIRNVANDLYVFIKAHCENMVQSR